MFWIVVIGIVIVAVAGLVKGQTRKPSRPVLVSSGGPTVNDPNFAAALSAWHAKIAAGFRQDRWIPKGAAEEYAASHPAPAWKGSPWANPIGKSTTTDLVREAIKKHNDSFLVRQRKARKDFFDTVEKNPLTAEQVDACICMDDNVMVVAAAGSGKTSTMVAKAGYVISEGLAQPSEILMLAFNSAAAKELGERVAKRLAGSDIAVMTEFETQFDNATRLVLGTTFRCPPKVCDVSSSFVQRNPAQIRKQVRTTNTGTGTAIRIIGLKNIEAAPAHIETELTTLYAGANEHRTSASVLLLGRYRDDEPPLLKSWQRQFGDRLEISYRTIHASKGLEAEHVFLLNVVAGSRGFPSRIEDDPVLQIAMPSPDDYAFAEERRLFYVALTRASRDIRIYTSLTKPSSFVNELQAQDKIVVEAIDGEATTPCPKCNRGTLRLRSGKHGQFLGCSEFPRCDHTQNLS